MSFGLEWLVKRSVCGRAAAQGFDPLGRPIETPLCSAACIKLYQEAQSVLGDIQATLGQRPRMTYELAMEHLHRCIRDDLLPPHQLIMTLEERAELYADLTFQRMAIFPQTVTLNAEFLRQHPYLPIPPHVDFFARLGDLWLGIMYPTSTP